MRKTNTFFLCPKAQTLPQPHFTDTGQLHAVYFLDSHNHGLIVYIYYPVQMMTIMGFNHGMHVPVVSVLGTLSNYDDDDDDDNDNAKKMGLWAKQQLCTCIKLFSTFVWRPLHEHDMKPLNATFYVGRGHTTANFPLSIWTWIKPLKNSTPGKVGYIWRIERFQIDATKFLKGRKFIFLGMFSPPSS